MNGPLIVTAVRQRGKERLLVLYSDELRYTEALREGGWVIKIDVGGPGARRGTSVDPSRKRQGKGETPNACAQTFPLSHCPA